MSASGTELLHFYAFSMDKNKQTCETASSRTRTGRTPSQDLGIAHAKLRVVLPKTVQKKRTSQVTTRKGGPGWLPEGAGDMLTNATTHYAPAITVASAHSLPWPRFPVAHKSRHAIVDQSLCISISGVVYCAMQSILQSRALKEPTSTVRVCVCVWKSARAWCGINGREHQYLVECKLLREHQNGLGLQ